MDTHLRWGSLCVNPCSSVHGRSWLRTCSMKQRQCMGCIVNKIRSVVFSSCFLRIKHRYDRMTYLSQDLLPCTFSSSTLGVTRFAVLAYCCIGTANVLSHSSVTFTPSFSEIILSCKNLITDKPSFIFFSFPPPWYFF